MTLSLENVSISSWPFHIKGIAYGQGNRLQLEVLYSEHDRTPSPTQLRSSWKARQNHRGVPLLIVVLHNKLAYLCGPTGEDPTVYEELDPGQIERICLEALEQPNRQAALRALRDSLGALEEEGLPGLRNEGFLATHELLQGVPTRTDWVSSATKSKSILHQRGNTFLQALGYTVERLDNVTAILKIGELKTAVALVLNEHESPETGSQRIPGTLSPVSYALSRADEENLDWVMLLNGPKIRLYPVKMGVGVGRRGRTETYVECHTGLIPDDQSAYLWLLFSAEALTEGGSLDSIMADSSDYAGDLASELRERIYDQVIPRLAEGLADARGIKKPTADDLNVTYQMAMTVLFRLLFIAYGEDKDLLPYRFNGLYQKRSLKAKAKDLLKLWNQGEGFGDGEAWWSEIKAIFHAIDKGNSSWGVPAYNGGLFSKDPYESPIGAEIERVTLPDNMFGPALQYLLLVPTNEGVHGVVDFRSLSVREFGTIYEGLLESELSVAETDLSTEKRGKNKGAYKPAIAGAEVAVTKGTIYLHNSSGARKSTGSYYTKHFAVEHLLDRSLEPALAEHFKRLDALEDLEAAESFFDFRTADIAMGSGHFLVAAIDRIEAKFSSYLSRRPLPLIVQEFDHLRKAAHEALGDAADSYPEFEDNALLRRLIARRCIYGVDINEVAVQLARLAIWVHTFVPGLPLSLLDRNLVHGNSLIGVGLLIEIEDKVREEGLALFQVKAADLIGDASAALKRLGQLADATPEELKEARQAWVDADKATSPARAMCDILTAARIEGIDIPLNFTRWEKWKHQVVGGKEHVHAMQVLQGVNQLHFPVVFPEVFLRDRSGFDVMLGNPPWEEARVEEKGFWARHFPGLRGYSQRVRKQKTEELIKIRPDLVKKYNEEIRQASMTRSALLAGGFPGMGTSDPDMYKAFLWRFWKLVVREGGQIGVVVPRSALAAKGSELFRKMVFKNAIEIHATTLQNSSRWVFDMEPRYTVALVTIKSDANKNTSVYLRGPYNSYDNYIQGLHLESALFTGDEILKWNDSAALPLLPDHTSIEVFRQLRNSPRLDSREPIEWYFRPYGELHSGSAQSLMDLESEECPKGYWPVYKGASFDLWSADTGKYYGWADPDIVTPVLQDRRIRGNSSTKSVYSECNHRWCKDINTLPCYHPRIAFRDVTNRTNRRTVICALVPPNVFLTDKAPYFLQIKGDVRDSIYLLGISSSLCLDWYARRYVETGVKFYLINSFPYPKPASINPLRKRVIKISARLACQDDRFREVANEVGTEIGPLNDQQKEDLIHELDAVVAHLYGLSENNLVHLFKTFHNGWDYQDRLNATLKHFDYWSNKL
jgi:hypothetical protein